MLWFAYSSTVFRCWVGLGERDRFEFVRKGPAIVHATTMASVGLHVLRVVRPRPE